MGQSTDDQLYIVMLSIHGLIRSENLELGRDADTGGQILYVIELMKALSRTEQVAQVDLLTRQVIDKKVSDDYAEPVDELNDKARIIRIECGPRRYLRKESLWPYLDIFADNAIKHINKTGTPSVIHAHYADAGYVGSQIARLLEVPFFFTGHSLGRVKKERLKEKGTSEEKIEKRYKITTRIEAEETALDVADQVITSTQQEIDEQYAMYNNYQPKKMKLLPPGIDLSRFNPPGRGRYDPPYRKEIDRFLRDPKKPLVLGLSRPDERKNICKLVEAYAQNDELRKKANLAIIAGSRDYIPDMERGPRKVLTQLLLTIDKYDLYGSVAYPKKNKPEEVPQIYKLAAKRKGVFVNPALTEPFGLTLVEAGACGLPLVATNDGGPRDIINLCKNGYLVDPHDAEEIGQRTLEIIKDRKQWNNLSRRGKRGVRKHYTWKGHVDKYLKDINRRQKKYHRRKDYDLRQSRMLKLDRLLITDIDDTLIGDDEAMQELMDLLSNAKGKVGFGIATGRRIESARKVLKDKGLPAPDVWITSVGTEIYYMSKKVADRSWSNHLDHQWQPDTIREILQDLDGLSLQPDRNQRQYKVSYYLDSKKAPSKEKILKMIRKKDLAARVIQSHGSLLDILPIRASKGHAIRHISMKWEIPPENILVSGDSGNDEDMLKGNTLGVVVGNYSQEIENLKDVPRIYFAKGEYAQGIIEGIEYYNFMGEIQIPEPKHDQ